MDRRIMIAGVVLISTVLASATDLESYKTIYKRNLDEIILRHGMKIVALQQQYASSLDGLLAGAKKKGDLEETTAIINEMERFQKEKAMPRSPSVLPNLKRLQLSFTKQSAVYDASKANDILTLVRKYDSALANLQKILVSSNKLDEARAILEERKNVTKSKTTTGAQHVLQQSTGATSNSSTQPSSQPSQTIPEKEDIIKEAQREEALILIYCDDGCDLYHNGDKVSFVAGKELNMTIQDGDVIAIEAWDTQGGTACGLLVGIKLESNKKVIGTDTSWIYSSVKEDGWENLDFNDKSWKRTQRSRLDWINNTANTAFKTWRSKPKPIWGTGSPVYFRKHILFRDFR